MHCVLSGFFCNLTIGRVEPNDPNPTNRLLLNRLFQFQKERRDKGFDITPNDLDNLICVAADDRNMNELINFIEENKDNEEDISTFTLTRVSNAFEYANNSGMSERSE